MDEKNFEALVIGGGIAGIAVAYAFAKRKQKVLLVERNSYLASEASGNPSGMVYPFLTKKESIDSIFSLKAFDYVHSILPKLSQKISLKTGAFLLPRTSEEESRYHGAKIQYNLKEEDLVSAKDPNSGRDGFFFSKAICLSPPQLIEALRMQCGEFLSIEYDTEINKYVSPDISSIKWKDTEINFKYLIFAQANEMKSFGCLDWLPFRKVRGQIVLLPKRKALSHLSCAYLFGDYLTPDLGHGSVLGASFDEYHFDESPRESETIEFLHSARKNLPFLEETIDELLKTKESILPRVSFRSQSQDRRPSFGILPNAKLLQRIQNELPKPQQVKNIEIPRFQNTFLLGSLGSRGLTHALLAGEWIVKSIYNELSSEEESIFKEFLPERFLIRAWKQGRLFA
ncbi:tRNA U-34 5-methylaminomethyl-2-thiouridine biosynthesis protein MnmC [Leptospira ryugenii]|uniref:tRNA U-34 5-methylaminomethyl-2-thiouridine biosynthesis protein MnmC n=1 Tax=Leptospira ryugenii TaxID=1917863 RepID=A0A2P2E137_9LEPT|nr:FAD-dependent 5-carboxymethylaminomethyl-2-thiouridine(34) oxidoreductase MnmC [Leptospira ryugenii]GBF50516.1 tRNA U-34 5-methylaminomethyl-2-thiouridine biosynthesis protein MnmC [Leptospira ryugenii]